MRARQYSSEGIVIARYKYSEADRLIVIFSRDYGKLSLLAKSVRRPKSRKRGSLEVFSRLKFSAARGKSLDILTETDLIDSFSDLRGSLSKVALIYYYLEVVNKITRDDDENAAVYDLLTSAIDELRRSSVSKKNREKFIKILLTELGYWPTDKVLKDADGVLAGIIEREISSFDVGRKLLS
jgi:DNA repair protein RecO (recombination protein O)